MSLRTIGDFGPIYFETDLNHFPVEPFNTYSNFVFLFILLFFCQRTRGDYRSFPASVLALPILSVGFVGGTLFHATRSYPLWLYLDFVPIALLVILASLYFWNRILKNLWLAAIITPLPFVTFRAMLLFVSFPRTIVISLSYVSMAMCIVLPAALCSWKRHGDDRKLLALSVISFICAILFRIGDSVPQVTAYFPMGTHFLWHIIGGISSGLLMEFLFRDEQQTSLWA